MLNFYNYTENRSDVSLFKLCTLKRNSILSQGCCNYGSVPAASPATSVTKAWDCLQIPGAKKTKGTSLLNNFCGGRLITSAPAAIAVINKTICSRPFFSLFFGSRYLNIVIKLVANIKL